MVPTHVELYFSKFLKVYYSCKKMNTRFLWLFPVSLSPLLYYLFLRPKPHRQLIVPPSRERVLILGASSGIGRAIAHLYASRDAYVCIIGRREDKLEAVKSECAAILPSHEDTKILKLSEDFSDIEGLLRIRERLTRGMS